MSKPQTFEAYSPGSTFQLSSTDGSIKIARVFTAEMPELSKKEMKKISFVLSQPDLVQGSDIFMFVITPDKVKTYIVVGWDLVDNILDYAIRDSDNEDVLIVPYSKLNSLEEFEKRFKKRVST